jgi:hypothetical protein
MRFVVNDVTCFVCGLRLAPCYRWYVQYVFLTLFPLPIYVFDRVGGCPTQCPITQSFAFSAEDEYRGGGYPV